MSYISAVTNYYLIRNRNRWATGKNFSKIIGYYISDDTSDRLIIRLLDKKLKINSIKWSARFISQITQNMV